MSNLNLYAYFGLLGTHEIDSPGHSFYQLGLIDSLRETFGDSKFDFYSYYPKEIKQIPFGVPLDELGNLFTSRFNSLISEYNLTLDSVLQKIKNKEYAKLYLKARFRNLSTLSKKWDDAFQFERIIEVAVESGYTKDQIIILDTDLSLPLNFLEEYDDKVKVLIPSIDFPGISNYFLTECMKINSDRIPMTSEFSLVFYGNLDTSNYKSGNEKSTMLNEVLVDLLTKDYGCSSLLDVMIVGKDGNDAILQLKLTPEKLTCHVSNVSRNRRDTLWKVLSHSLIMLNVTKEKYNDARFIPARIYEAMIFGMIPVSYKFDFLNKTFSFSNLFEFNEIMKYLYGVDKENWKKAYLHFCTSYLDYVNLRNPKNP